jgi:hypothetical protein
MKIEQTVDLFAYFVPVVISLQGNCDMKKSIHVFSNQVAIIERICESGILVSLNPGVSTTTKYRSSASDLTRMARTSVVLDLSP